MKYQILVTFYGYSVPTRFIAKNAKHRDELIKKLKDEYCIVKLEVNKMKNS